MLFTILINQVSPGELPSVKMFWTLLSDLNGHIITPQIKEHALRFISRKAGAYMGKT